MLIAYEFLLFFEVSNDLLQRLLQDLDFALVYLNLLALVLTTRLILVLRALVERNVTLQVLVQRL